MSETESFIFLTNSILQKQYGLTLSDTGYSVEDWLLRFGDMQAEEAVRCYGEKYDLISKDEGPLF